MAKSKRDEKVVATLRLTVEYEQLPGKDDLDELIEKLRELGYVGVAELTIHKKTVTHLV